MSEDFERRRKKLMYKFIKGCCFEHPKSSYNCRVNHVFDTKEHIKHFSEEYASRQLKARINKRWDRIDSDRTIEWKQPDGAKFIVYPKQFRCPSCQRVRIVRHVEAEDMSMSDDLECEYCGENLYSIHQVSKVQICTEGHMNQLRIPECPNCDQKMGLNSQSRDISRVKWVCKNCSTLKNIYHENHNCRECGVSKKSDRLSIANIDSSRIIYPRRLELINAHKSLDKIYKGQTDFMDRVREAYLSENTEILDKSGSIEDNISNVETAYEMYENNNEDIAREIMQSVEDVSMEDVIDYMERRQSYSDFKTEKKSKLRGIFEYMSIVNEEEIGISSDENRRDQETKVLESSVSQEQKEPVREFKNQFGLESIHLFRDLPFTSITYGYTRKNPNPSEARLMTYGNRDGPMNVYANHMRAEGVLFKLSDKRIFDWLKSNKIITKEGVDEPTNTEEMRKMLIDKGLNPSFEEIEEHKHIAKAVYRLLHTISHLVINSLGKTSGYKSESLVERILPHVGSVIILNRPEQNNFNLGSIHNTLEKSTERFHQEICSMEKCVRDDICSANDGGSCDECLYISTKSCQNTNLELSRKYVFGGENIDPYYKERDI